MAFTKPSKFPRFGIESDGSTGVSVEIEEPSEAKKSIGWVVEEPPHQFFNWLHNLVASWLWWFDQEIVSIGNSIDSIVQSIINLGNDDIADDSLWGEATSSDALDEIRKTLVNSHPFNVQAVSGAYPATPVDVVAIYTARDLHYNIFGQKAYLVDIIIPDTTDLEIDSSSGDGTYVLSLPTPSQFPFDVKTGDTITELIAQNVNVNSASNSPSRVTFSKANSKFTFEGVSSNIITTQNKMLFQGDIFGSGANCGTGKHFHATMIGYTAI